MQITFRSHFSDVAIFALPKSVAKTSRAIGKRDASEMSGILQTINHERNTWLSRYPRKRDQPFPLLDNQPVALTISPVIGPLISQPFIPFKSRAVCTLLSAIPLAEFPGTRVLSIRWHPYSGEWWPDIIPKLEPRKKNYARLSLVYDAFITFDGRFVNPS